MSEQKRILEMIEKGQITAEEGMDLLNALKDTVSVEEVPAEIISKPKKHYEFLKVKVNSEKDDTKVNVNIPLKLVKSLGGLAGNINSYIPDDAKEKMGDQGINLENLDFDALIAALEEGADYGPLVDVETEDEEAGRTTVKVYVE